ncbi:MAG: class I tRNA ligase family protein [Patescibacteria group bacterium]
MKKYNHKKIEIKWQKIWAENQVVKIDKDDTKNKFYMLDMFPYPSGEGLHMGHTESYTASDVYTRFKTMQGFNVLHPQGFDAFGLPAENYAIKTGIDPKTSTAQNISNFIGQMKSLGLRYDFDEKVVTYEPEYYKWTQWLFTKFFENDLVYKKTSKINWCESCQTGIANEQVVGGACERCGTQIVQKEIPGWFFKITDFADALIDDLDTVDWPEYTKKNQKNWVGRSEGALIKFQISKSKETKLNPNDKIQKDENFIEVFTTRPDTLFGATYMVLAPEHELLQELKSEISNWDEVEKYISDSQKKTEMDRIEAKEKTGVKLEGISAINPANSEEISVFIADYVLSGYGTGAIMAVPAHDERDFEFATKFEIEIREVISPEISKYLVVEKSLENCEENLKKFGEIKINSHDEDWGNFYEVLVLKDKEQNFIDYLKNNLLPEEISKASSFYTDSCGTSNYVVFKDNVFKVLTKQGLEEFKKYGRSVGIPEEQLDVKPTVFTEKGILMNSGQFDGMSSEEAKKKITEFVGGELTTNYRLRDWSMSRQRYWGCPIPIVYSPEGEPKLVPEEHLPWLLPIDVDFVPSGKSPLEKSMEFRERTEKIFGKGWTPEFDTMDTFVDSSWYFLRYPDAHNDKEFCSQKRKQWLPVDLYIGGAEHTYMHLLFSRFFVKAMQKIGLLNFNEPFLKLRHQGMVLDANGKKMSKSKGNVVNPNEMVERFGADSVRTYMLFAAPLEDEVMWNENNIVGVYRFLERVWNQAEKLESESSDKVKNALHKTIRKVQSDVEDLKYNTAVSEMMKLINLIKDEKISQADYEIFLKILAPFAPHMTEELWYLLHKSQTNVDGTQTDVEKFKSIHNEKWPEFDENLAKDTKHIIVIQVNGKVRSEIEIEEGEPEEAIKEKALNDENIKKWIGDNLVKKAIYIKDKLLNIVV